MDSQTIEVFGLIKDLQVFLKAFPDITIEMDIVVIDVPDVWGMLINRKSAADLGGSIQMDLSYATLPTPSGGTFRLDREPYHKNHVGKPKAPVDELLYEEESLGNYAILSNSIVPLEDKVKDNELDKVWYMHFDGACYPRYLGITRRSCLEAHMVLDMEYREWIDLSMALEGPSFFFSASFVLSAVPTSITTGLGLYQRGLLLHEVIGPRYHGMCHI